MTYYVYREELTSYYHPEEGGYYQEGGHIVEIAECQTFKKARLKLRKWLKKEELAEDERYFQGYSWIANNKQSYGLTGKYIGERYECGISRRKPDDRGFEPYC